VYGSLIAADNIFDWIDMNFTVEGELPKGRVPEADMRITSVGELYGVPAEVGEYPIKVTANFTAKNSQVAFTPSEADLRSRCLRTRMRTSITRPAGVMKS